jgi:ABC-type uncharacterized transport system auxiliary subunit
VLLFLVLTGALAGCGGLFHSNARPEQVYYLESAPIPAGTTPVAASLRFNRPTVSPGLETSRIMTVESDRRLSFFEGSRWPAPTSNLVETLAVEKLRGARLWESVADSSSQFPSDYVLQVTVRRFEADYTSGATNPEIHVVLDCLVGKREGREVVASFLAEGKATASTNKMSGVIPAFETATNAAIDSMASQTLDAMRASMAHKTAAN